MRRFDKFKNIQKINILLEERRLKESEDFFTDKTADPANQLPPPPKTLSIKESTVKDLNSDTLYQYNGLFTWGANEGKKVKGTCKYIETVGTDNDRFRFKWIKVAYTDADYFVGDNTSFYSTKEGLKYLTPIKSLSEDFDYPSD